MMKSLSRRQIAESFVFVKMEPQNLHFQQLVRGSLQLRSHADTDHPHAVTFVEGIDYQIDYEKGRISRTEESRIADWSEHVLYGVKDFDHTIYADYSNHRFTVYAEYNYVTEESADVLKGNRRDSSDIMAGVENSSDGLHRVKQKLASGLTITYVVYGDSISTGGEASEDKFAYYSRFAAQLSAMYPDGSVNVLNMAVGGETSEGGVNRVIQDVVLQHPDLVTIGYGMNDQNKFSHGNCVSLAEYEQNIRFMINKVQQETQADIVLVTPCQPNPLWRYTSGQIGDYAAVLQRLGEEYSIGVADAYSFWQHALDSGKTPESLLLNNINHPNDYGHWLYYKAFEPII